MPEANETNRLLVELIRDGDSTAWNRLIERYEGRLISFCNSRLSNRSASEDIVQETFVGFLTSLPNYDGGRPLESYLFTICAYKLTDHLRREGSRPKIPLDRQRGGEGSELQIPGSDRGASTLVRSRERRGFEENAIVDVLTKQVDRCRQRRDWTKLKCLELLFLRGWPNNQVANRLGLSAQQVANYKSDFLIQLRRAMKKLNLPNDLFPELQQD